MFSESKKRIRFVMGGFSTPVLGNVWEGRVAILAKKTAQRHIDLGHADEIDEKGNIIQKAAMHEPAPVTGTEQIDAGVKFVKAPEKSTAKDADDKADDPADAAAGAEERTDDADGEGKVADEGAEETKEQEAKTVAAEGHSPKKRSISKKKK